MRGTNPLRPGVIALSAIVSAAILANATDVHAQVTACTAAMDHDIHYCNDDTDIDPTFSPTCAPLGIQWAEGGVPGDVVTVTVEIRNDGEFQGVASPQLPASPPGAELVAGTTIAVFYACSDPTCEGGQELPDWLVFESVAYAHPDVTFADDGNGYSGTLTILNDIPFPQGDPAPQKLVRINLKAGERLPDGPVHPNAILYARSGQPGVAPFDASANALKVMDPDCPLAGPLGGGQGTTAGQLMPAPLDGGLGVCAHANKQTIKIDKSGNLDFGSSRVSFHFPGYDPGSCDLTFGYDNLVGGPFAFPTLMPGDLQKAGKCYIYQDKNASNAGGIQRAQVCPLNSDPDRWCLTIKAHGDLAGILQDPEMPITIDTCGNSYAGPQAPPHAPPVWTPGAGNWTLPKAVWTE